jgi:hypothetical protein
MNSDNRKTKEILRSLIRESILQEADMNLVPHAEVVAAIDNAIRPERLDIPVVGFRDLMIEIAIVESGIADGGKLYHNNEMSGDIRGVFQLSPIALNQLRQSNAVPRTKEQLDKSAAMQKNWVEQSDSEIFGSIRMQALAACMYALWAYYSLANEPSLTSQGSRANFWKSYYNTKADKAGSVALFNDRVRELRRLA